MSTTKVTGIAMMLRRHTLLNATRPPLCGVGSLGDCFASIPKDGSDAVRGMEEKAKQTTDDVLGVAKDAAKKLKDQAMESGSSSKKPSKDPDQNHGVERTDSACEDVRGRPGGYS
ncbi:hypothetical protein CTI12_AA451400 [Artemisia annua]|uniref:Uncharacterized protein n=1 Tax=Artemisia annua TaxID=35608 RepID=A0A2U1LI84_ARTAN|nr:hypothetical protein CTI12_AA451400 [Artemisia annua]